MRGFYRRRVYMPLLFCAFLLSLFACTKDKKDASTPPGPAAQPDRQIASASPEIIALGTAVLKFQITGPANAMQIVASADDVELRLLRLTAPDGEILFDAERISDQRISEAWEFQSSPHTFNYPLRADQPPVISGTYKAIYETREAGRQRLIDAKPALDVITKNDPDLTRGTITLNVIFGNVAVNSKDTRDGINAALRISRIMLERFGILVFTEVIPAPNLPSVLPNPATGADLYYETSAAVEGGINLFFGNAVESFSSRSYVSAIAGSSPGPVIPSRKSAVVVDLRKALGSDGRFDADDGDSFDNIDDSEVRLLAESVTQEILQYMGLPESMRFSGGTVIDTDGLNSEKCPNLEACEENKGANGNLMFPFPLKIDQSSKSSFYPRDRLSTEQAELVHRYVGMD